MGQNRRRFVSRVLAAFALTGLLGAAVAAQDPITPPSEAAAMTQIILQRVQAAAPPPGIYQLMAMHSSFCLATDPGGGARVSFLKSVGCGDRTIDSRVMLVPHPSGGVTVRTELGSTRVATRRTSCATVARGVVLGTPAIDVRPCEFPDIATSPSWCSVGVGDQVFRFRPASPNVFVIRQRDAESPNIDAVGDQCWDVRGASLDIGAETIRFDCNGGANQLFAARFLAPIDAPEEAGCAAAQGWRDTPDGLRRIVPVVGIDLRGGDYASDPTENDQGRSCAAKCGGDERCRAFTWAAPGVQGENAMCWLKNSVPPPSAAGKEIASGIVR